MYIMYATQSMSKTKCGWPTSGSEHLGQQQQMTQRGPQAKMPVVLLWKCWKCAQIFTCKLKMDILSILWQQFFFVFLLSVWISGPLGTTSLVVYTVPMKSKKKGWLIISENSSNFWGQSMSEKFISFLPGATKNFKRETSNAMNPQYFLKTKILILQDLQCWL